MDIAIIGGGNSALEAAIEMNGIARNVHLVSRGAWTGDEILQDKTRVAESVEPLEGHEPLEIYGSGKVEALTVKDLKSGALKQLDVQGVFIEIGLFPNTDFALDILETNDRGEIIVDNHGASGAQIVIAAGAGAKAALAAFEYLITQH
jgi:alkyl hydroperoxide reductase subunit F